MSYRYKHMELALARTFKVEAEDMPAFRARMRHLRNLGLPNKETPGSGRQLEYERTDIIRMLIALEFELFGFSPKLAVDFVTDRHYPARLAQWEKASRQGDPLFLRIEPLFAPHPSHVTTSKTPATDGEHRGAFVNVAASISILDYHLKQLTKRE